ncbi:cytochrome c nitrite reductase small subunit [Helicobacter sp. 12S02634-8]|uniref:cytochrome c nitrite reductase small subunit n=1 Tax=Helicobacter sp. 12S02634-8 TaxID=1476199 RepID=UPI000BA7BBC6|nr:cytochrome c nitrite reductase small subunit [Helicobacter sp. 12S02634-8]PAF47135.1 cytochrome c nitrite reductase small subunit [Helicobacter sp. 12S02634-8]
MKTSKPKTTSFLVVLAVFVVVAGLGGGIYTFYNAKGFSYLSNQSSACNNCHVMNEVYDDWNKSSHKEVATCSDCHLPHELIPKWIAKAQSGIGHAYAFTFDKNLPMHFSATKKTQEIVQENCIRCHLPYVKNVVNPTLRPEHQDQSLKCVSCHQGVGHSRGF